MNKEDIVSHLLKIGTPEAIALVIAEKGKLENIKTGGRLVSVGDKVPRFFIVLSGAFVVQHVNSDKGIKRTTNCHLPNYQSMMTIVESYFLGNKSRYEINAITNSNYLSIDKKSIEHIIQKYPEYTTYLQNEIIRGFVSENMAKNNLLTLSANELYVYLQKNMPEMIQQVPAKYIAEYMGISREYLSRLKRKNLNV